MITPDVAVIVLCYNNSDLIMQTLSSIFIQKDVKIQLIISDDHSDMFDADSLRSFISKSAPPSIIDAAVLQTPENLGTVAHANAAARLAEAGYVKFLSCGDSFYDPDSLYRLWQFASSCKEDAVSSVSCVCSEDLSRKFYYFPGERRLRLLLRSTPGQLFSVLAASNIMSASGSMFRKRFFDGRGFDEEYKYLEDLPLWLSLSRSGVRIPCLDKVTVNYTIGGNSSKCGTAYDSALLHPDMIKCYEKELLPYLGKMTPRARYYVRYHYLNLTQFFGCNSLRQFIYKIYFLPLHIFFGTKKLLKGLLVNVTRR